MWGSVLTGSLREAFEEAFEEAFGKAFGEVFGKAFRKPSRKLFTMRDNRTAVRNSFGDPGIFNRAI
jgi:hypothetical protein